MDGLPFDEQQLSHIVQNLDWNNFVVNDQFRSMTPGQQSQIREQYMHFVAPNIYPEIQMNPEARGAVSRMVYGTPVIPKHPLEDQVIMPEATQSHQNWGLVENNATYSRLSYQEQQQLKSVWFMKMARDDPMFKGWSPEEKNAYYERLMERQPSYGFRHTGAGKTIEHAWTTGLFETPPVEDLWEGTVDPDEEIKGWHKFLLNFSGSFMSMGLALLSGPAALVAPDSGVAQWFRDARKQRDWMNAVDDQANFWTEGLPTFLGGTAGIIGTGMYGMFEKAFATAGAAALGKLAPAVPGIVGRATGAGIAGMIHGISQSIGDGERWYANLPSDATLGLAFEFGGRWLAGIRQARGLAKSLGVSVEELLNPATDGIRGKNISRALEVVTQGNANSARLINDLRMVNQNGLSLETLKARSGVDMVADTLNLRATHNADSIELWDTQPMRKGDSVQVVDAVLEGGEEVLSGPARVVEIMPDSARFRGEEEVWPVGTVKVDWGSGARWVPGDKVRFTGGQGQGNLVARFEGTENTQINNAINFMLNDPKRWEVWEQTLQNKGLMEGVTTAPAAEVRHLTEVPEIARMHIEDYFNKHGAAGYFSRAENMHEAVLAMDDVYTVMRRGSVKKASEALTARGVELDGGGDAHKSAVAQLRKELNELSPESAYFIVNRNTPKGDEPRIVDIKDIPVVFIEDPKLMQAAMYDGVYTGPAGSIREVLTNLRKSYIDADRAATTLLRTKQGVATHFKDTDVIEIRMTVPDGANVPYDVVLHVPGIKRAEELLQIGVNTKHKTLLDAIFGEDLSPSVRESFDEFAKGFKDNPQKFHTDFAPYAFAVKIAQDKGYFLGNVGGRYVLEDAHHLAQGKYTLFDDLHGVLKYLEEKPLDVLPDMVPGVSRSLLETQYSGGIEDPMKFEVEVPEVPVSRQQGILMRTGLNFTRPTQYAIQQLEQTRGGAFFREKGIPLTRIYDNIEESNRALTAFINEKGKITHRLKKGLHHKEYSDVYRYIEAIDNPAELDQIDEAVRGLYSTKANVYDELVQTYGAERAQFMASKATEITQYFDEMFVRTGMNWSKFVQHYMPHIRAEAAKAAGNMNSHFFEYTSNIRMSEPDRKAFYEMLRESEPGRVVFETDVSRLLDQYTHMVARNSFLRPTMKRLRSEVNNLIDSVTSRGAIDNDYVQVAEYLKQMFDSVDGVHSITDAEYINASRNLFGRLGKAMDKLETGLGKNTEPGRWEKRMNARSKNFIDTLVTWSTGAHLAGRPYTVLRNATQPLMTTAPLVGLDWVLHGYDQLMKPGMWGHMEDLGVISRREIPVAGWANMEMDNFIKKAVAIGMYPFKEVDAVSRAVSYLAGHDRAMHAFNRRSDNKIRNNRAFLVQSGALNYGKPEHAELAEILNKAPTAQQGADAFSDRLGWLAVQRSQYMYNQWDQPQKLRTGIGRWFGQYTSWPLNYMNLVGNIIGPRSGMPAIERVRALATMTAVSGAIGTAMYEAGLNPAGFMPWEMADLAPGPQFSMMINMIKGVGGDRQALFSVIRDLSKYYPFAGEASGLYRAWQAMEDDDWTEALLHMASAPMNYDVYPRRDEIGQPILEKLYKSAAAYSEMKMNGARTFGTISEGVRNVLD